MRRLVPTSWCFLIYWVFLVNFGPSFHHADLFGLHSHPHGAANCGSHHHHVVKCCDHDHGTDGGHRHDTPQTPETSVVSLASDVDCVCCKFFEHYNVCFSPVELLDNHAFGVQLFSFTEGRPSVGDLEAFARGPPSSIARV